MKEMQQDSANLIDEMIHELWSLRSYYLRLMACGLMLSLSFFLSACFVIHPFLGRLAACWLGAALFCGVIWIYLKAFQRMKFELRYYTSLYGARVPRNTIRFAPIASAVRNAFSSSWFFFFFVGFLLASLVAVRLQDEYETGLFDSLARKVTGGNPNVPRDSILVRSLHITHALLASRSGIYHSPRPAGLIDGYLHPLSSDLVTADGACGSYANVLCRILQILDINTRLVQMVGQNGKVCHILLEAESSAGWVVLDPLYDLYFTGSNGKMASFHDVSADWNRFHTQTPPFYNPNYAYTGVRYTNWDKIPLIMPVMRAVMGWKMNKDALDHFSLRVYFLRKYLVIEYILAAILLLFLTPHLIRLLKKPFYSIRFPKKPVSVSY